MGDAEGEDAKEAFAIEAAAVVLEPDIRVELAGFLGEIHGGARVHTNGDGYFYISTIHMGLLLTYIANLFNLFWNADNADASRTQIFYISYE